MKIHKFRLAACVSALYCLTSWAAVTPEEAKQLGTTLTPFGAEKAANADGSIPAYSNAPLAAPAGYKADGHYLDLFPNEKPLYSISAKNMGQYAGMLTEGTKGLMERFPEFRVDVYPTHRTARYSDWSTQQIAKNATRSKLIGDGDGVEGSYGPIPFPIPKNGYEVLWNHFMMAKMTSIEFRGLNTLVDTAGRANIIGDLSLFYISPYMDRAKDALQTPYYQKYADTYNLPASQAGEQILAWYSSDATKSPDTYWSYTPGQRRVRVAPEFAYDTPAASFGGAILFDEISLFLGRPDRFDFKMVGKKEMIIPYNANKLHETTVKSSDLFGKSVGNPDFLRWEKHRVWVLEATVKTGKRHVYSKRRFYVDEDTWRIIATESYDQGGKLYRVGIAAPMVLHDKPEPQFMESYYIYDLIKGNYVLVEWFGGDKRYFVRAKPELDYEKRLTPEGVQASGVR